MSPGNESISAKHLPYQICLISSLSEDLQHQVRNVSNYIVVSLDTLLAVISLICNGLIFITITRTKSLRHPSLLMLSSLSLTDLVWALFTLVRNSLVFIHPHMYPKVGNEQKCIGILCYLATLSNLAIISRDRFLAMGRPMWYRSYVSRLRAGVVKKTILAWLSSILTTLTVYTLLETVTSSIGFVVMIAILFYVVCISIILFNYVRFLMVKQKQSRNMQMQMSNMHAVIEKEKKLTRIISVILLCFLLSFLPALLAPVVLQIALGLPQYPFTPFMFLLFTFNGLFNPLLNYGRNKEIRRAVVNFFRCRHTHVSQQPPAER